MKSNFMRAFLIGALFYILISFLTGFWLGWVYGDTEISAKQGLNLNSTDLINITDTRSLELAYTFKNNFRLWTEYMWNRMHIVGQNFADIDYIMGGIGYRYKFLTIDAGLVYPMFKLNGPSWEAGYLYSNNVIDTDLRKWDNYDAEPSLGYVIDAGLSWNITNSFILQTGLQFINYHWWLLGWNGDSDWDECKIMEHGEHWRFNMSQEQIITYFELTLRF